LEGGIQDLFDGGKIVVVVVVVVVAAAVDSARLCLDFHKSATVAAS